jgi:hypothetical protein
MWRCVLLVFLAMDPTLQSVHATCTVGQYLDTTLPAAQQACADCPGGYYAATNDLSACHACDATHCATLNAVVNAGRKAACDGASQYSQVPCDLCPIATHFDDTHKKCAECPGGSVNNETGKAECKPCDRNEYAVDGIECKTCDGNKVPNDGHDTCVDRNTEAAVPVWIIEGYAGLLMVVGMLNVIASTSLKSTANPNQVLGWVTVVVTLAMIITLTYTLGKTTPSSGHNGTYFIAVLVPYLLIEIASWIAQRRDFVKTEGKISKSTGKDLNDSWRQFFRDHPGFTLTLMTSAFVIFIAVRVSEVGEKSNLRRYDVSTLLVLQLLIQLELSYLLKNTEGEGNQDPRLLAAMIILMLAHAVAFPVAIVRRIRMAPKDTEVHPSQLTNLHYIADFFGLMTAGMAVALMIVEKSHDSSESAQEKVTWLKTSSAQLEQVIIDRSCESVRQDSRRVMHWNLDSVQSIRLRVHQIVDEFDEAQTCDLASAVMQKNHLKALPWVVLLISKCPNKDMTTRVSLDSISPLELCKAATDGARSVSQFLIDLAYQTQTSTIHVSNKFAIMVLVADAYYGALYNVADMANAMTAQEDVMTNLWINLILGIVPSLAFFAFIAYGMMTKRDTSEIISHGHRLECTGEFLGPDDQRCANGWVHEAHCPAEKPCLPCPRTKPYSYQPPRDTYAEYLTCTGMGVMRKGVAVSHAYPGLVLLQSVCLEGTPARLAKRLTSTSA